MLEQAITSYLSWDRRTKVIGSADNVEGMLITIQTDPTMDRLDVVILDTRLAENKYELVNMITRIQDALQHAQVICLGHEAESEIDFVNVAQEAGATAYFIREHVGAGIANAVRFALVRQFTVTDDLAMVGVSAVLPSRRNYPRLTRRIDQAIRLCVVEGLTPLNWLPKKWV